MLDIPGLQHRERRQRAAHRANGSRQVHDAGQGVHPPDAGPVAEADRRAAAPIPDRVAQLLRLLPNPDGAHQTRSVDTPDKFQAAVAAASPTAFWRMSGHVTVQSALRNHYFDALGLPRLHIAR